MAKNNSKPIKLPKAVYGSDKTPLRLGKIDIPCYVLDDGRRVLSRSGIQKAIGYTGQSGEMLTRLVTTKNGFPDEIVAGVQNSIQFIRNDAGGSRPMTNGYEAPLFIDICSAIIDLNRAGDYLAYGKQGAKTSMDWTLYKQLCLFPNSPKSIERTKTT